MWFAILITVLAAAGNNIGKVLQKQATRTLPRLTLNRGVILLYLRSGLWLTGMLTDLGGALLMIVAFAYAPERLQWHEWLAAAVAFCGVLGLGASAEQSHLEHPTVSPWRVLGAFGAMVALLGFILAAKLSVLCVPLGLAGSVGLTSSGFLLQTRGLKAGNTVVVCVAAATSSMICGVLAGMVALDEKLPSGHGMKAVRLASWLCILLGVSCLAGGTEALAATARALAACSPPWMLRLVPRPLAVSVHKLQKRRTAEPDEVEVAGVV
ncbi:hypothetical protein GPECTOR_83g305 [Gonium pectorale]|uniref:Uncharacterized protein n=1 Tax=Gonium pectorale TaxID=33097 RepID=A0A150G1F3_GONPE|nr:hypothetical protein GPECTOR_83g305 [Gonium pectorale]|eukprot:KXZ43693.1 hypothetical protein GPECTOR_83g305 [Gonium pectorale]